MTTGSSIAFARCCRVLLVDGNLQLLALFSTLLEREGYTVETACSGKEAITTAANFRPKVAFVCMELPIMSGYETAKGFRQTGHHDLAIVAMTTNENECNTAGWQSAGFDYVLPKPVNIERMLTVLRAVEAKGSRAKQSIAGLKQEVE